MREHQLKSWPPYYEDVESGRKSFELRFNGDRQFGVGDLLILREWSPRGDFTGRSCKREVVYVLHGVGIGGIAPLHGLSVNYVILGLKVVT